MENNKEIWVPVRGYEYMYEVSSKGRVRSVDRVYKGIKYQGQLLKQSVDRYGYVRVYLSKCGEKLNIRVHRLVAEAFIPNPEDKPEVNHKDLNKKNNTLENLEWVSRQENLEHAWSNRPKRLKFPSLVSMVLINYGYCDF